jgi:hypothetical protein
VPWNPSIIVAQALHSSSVSGARFQGAEQLRRRAATPSTCPPCIPAPRKACSVREARRSCGTATMSDAVVALVQVCRGGDLTLGMVVCEL